MVLRRGVRILALVNATAGVVGHHSDIHRPIRDLES